MIYRVVSRSRSGAVDVVGSAFTYLDSLPLQGSPVLAGLGGANSAQGTVTPPRRTLFRASSLGARSSSPSPTVFNRLGVSCRPASSFVESRDPDVYDDSLPVIITS